jgi:hypothetical protein
MELAEEEGGKEEGREGAPVDGRDNEVARGALRFLASRRARQ